MLQLVGYKSLFHCFQISPTLTAFLLKKNIHILLLVNAYPFHIHFHLITLAHTPAHPCSICSTIPHATWHSYCHSRVATIRCSQDTHSLQIFKSRESIVSRENFAPPRVFLISNFICSTIAEIMLLWCPQSLPLADKPLSLAAWLPGCRSALLSAHLSSDTAAIIVVAGVVAMVRHVRFLPKITRLILVYLMTS